MSMILCDRCDRMIDSDDDPDCFVEVGNMRRLHKEIVLCEPCRDCEQFQRDMAEAQAEAASDDEIETGSLMK